MCIVGMSGRAMARVISALDIMLPWLRPIGMWSRIPPYDIPWAAWS